MGSDSLYHICPSVSPENASPGTDTWLSKDATMDVAIAREVFGLLLEMGHKFRVDKKELERMCITTDIFHTYIRCFPVPGWVSQKEIPVLLKRQV